MLQLASESHLRAPVIKIEENEERPVNSGYSIQWQQVSHRPCLFFFTSTKFIVILLSSLRLKETSQVYRRSTFRVRKVTGGQMIRTEMLDYKELRLIARNESCRIEEFVWTLLFQHLWKEHTEICFSANEQNVGKFASLRSLRSSIDCCTPTKMGYFIVHKLFLEFHLLIFCKRIKWLTLDIEF